MKRFIGKTVIITGAARGVGKETAIEFLKEGANTVMTDISDLSIDTQVLDSQKVLPIRADIADSSDVEKLIVETIKNFKKIDYLVNNAGITMTKNMLELEKDDWDKVLGVNVKGTFDILKKVARHMIDNSIRGSIVNIASIAGEKGRPDFLSYAASKAAVISMTKSASLALADHNIRINAVSPGTIDTPMWEKVASDIIKMKGGSKEALLKSWIEKVPLGRLAKPSDISSMILYLCSDSAQFITGQVINVCGGLSLL